MNENKIKSNSSKTSMTKIIILVLIGMFIIYTGARYLTDSTFRYYIDSKVLKKEVNEEEITNIEIDSEQSPYIYAYNKYIVTLLKNTLTIYNQNGIIENTLTMNISTPLFVSNGNYLLVADKGGQNLYIISGTNILWQKTIDGDIYQANINQNGYISLIIQNTINKSVVSYYDNQGTELFNTYLSNSYVTCSDISSNNSYLAIGEIDYSGTVIKSIIKIISVEKAKTDANNSMIYEYTSNKGSILTNLKYIDKSHVIASFNDYIAKISTDSAETIYEMTNDDLFVDINAKNNLVIISKQSSGLFSYEYELTLKDYNSKKETLYILNSDLPKTLQVNDNILAIDLGTEVELVSNNGILKKHFTSSTQLTDIVLGDSVAGIIYKDKIEIIKF